ncbi:hypothetical protein [Streptomyces sp. WAC 04229]|uniref:hypothetical protein n=1 Tax=Streptomyces sp. WAC 04229 TaxID=2203206 RepID=UPI000F74088A|nr:hypothetical protein [Streptomyces sp. WAC 04229]
MRTEQNEREQAQREREQAQRDEEWQQRHFQQEWDRERKSDREGQARRVIGIRASTRNYLEFLENAYRKLTSGTPVDLEVFEDGFTVVHLALNSAFDEALLDGIWMAHARQSSFLISRRGSMNSAVGGGRGVAVDATNLGNRLIDARELVESCVRNGPPISDELCMDAERALRAAVAARDELIAEIKARLDEWWSV